MGRLAGFSYREIVRKLRRAGFTFDRQAKGSHEIWWNPETRKRTTISQTILAHCPKKPFEPSLSRLI